MSERSNISNDNSPILWGGVALVAYLGIKYVVSPLAKGKAIVKYASRFRFNIIAVRFKGDNINIDVYIQNPNSYPLIVRAVVGDVYVISKAGKIKIGDVARYGTTIIRPVNETKFTITVKLKFIQLLAYFNSILAGKIADQTLQFTGTINIDNVPYPITENYKIA